MIVDGGYMFLMDPDMSSFPCITWHCPKYRWYFTNTQIHPNKGRLALPQIQVINLRIHKYRQKHPNTVSLALPQIQVKKSTNTQIQTNTRVRKYTQIKVPKYANTLKRTHSLSRVDKCPASFVTRITNVEKVN